MHCEVRVSNEISLLTEKKSLYLQSTSHVWKESEERYLIDLRLQRTKSHDILWGEIATEMKKNGIHVTKLQLINKWKALKKKYKEFNDENNKTGK